MSTITREFTKEQLQQIIETDHVQCGEASALARIALASLEAEPVAWLYSASFERGHVEGELTDAPGCDMPVYTSPPAPVSVPAAMEMDDDFDSAFEHGKAVGWNAYRAAMLQGAEPVSQPYTLAANSFTNKELEGMAHGDNPQANVYRELLAYRLNASGWTPCSERMPAKLLPVMVMYEDGEMWSAIWTGTKWDDGTEVPDPHAVTHWQEMPAAPQQEVK